MWEFKMATSKFLLSTDVLWGYWLDLIFRIAKDVWFDWLDLALRKAFDSWNVEYVKWLIEQYELPIRVIQVSDNLNRKEMNHAVDIARAVWANVISINAPGIMNFKAFKFIKEFLRFYLRANANIQIWIINPEKNNFLNIVPTHYFGSIQETVKKYRMRLAIDVSNMEEEKVDYTLIRKLSNILPHLILMYVSDKGKTGKWHVPLWDGVLKLPQLFKRMKQMEYQGDFSLKVDISKENLVDIEKVKIILKKCKTYYIENYTDIKIV